jgi:NADPH:quinone reductase-like Zn-dependent oxidoreductase
MADERIDARRLQTLSRAWARPGHDIEERGSPMTYRSVFRPGLFQDRVMLVTGAGSGIGRCIAHELAALGARVALVGRTSAKLEAVREELRSDPARVFAHACDLRQEEPVKAMIAAALAWAGRGGRRLAQCLADVVPRSA